MAKQLWINLPVADIERARRFFAAIGWTVQPQHPSTDGVGILVGGVQIMLFPEETFRGFVKHEMADPARGSEVLFSFSAESREEIDELAARVEQAGGSVFAKPASNQGWMYGFGFADPDGHRWNGLFMDPAGPAHR